MKSARPRVRRALVAVGVILALSVVTVLAYLSASAGMIKNTFESAQETDPIVQETWNPDVRLLKQNVSVNVGDPGYAVYVRAAIVVNWAKDDSTVHATVPVLGTDYKLDINTKDWFKGTDGYYYLKTMVTSGDTPVLINECYQTGAAPDGYNLSVNIIAQTIQALGTTDGDSPIPAVQDAWGVTVNADKELTKPDEN